MTILRNLLGAVAALFLAAGSLPQALAAGPSNDASVPPRQGAWVLADQRALLDVRGSGAQADTSAQPKPLLPVVQEFKELIEGDPELYMLFQ